MKDLVIGPDGEFTEESWQRLLESLRDGPGKGIEPVILCSDSADANKIIEFAENRRNDPHRAPYNWNPLKMNTCIQFSRDAVRAGLP